MSGQSYPELIVEEIGRLGEDGAVGLLRQWIGQAEHLYLDFVAKHDHRVPTLHIDDRRNFSKAISGFGNSDGGLVVWGIDVRKDASDLRGPDVAQQLVPIERITTFWSELNGLIRLATKSVVPGVVNHRIFEDRREDRGYLVTYVPVGLHPPYRAELDLNNHYYKRAGSVFYPMEPFDIRDVVFRQNYPKVEVTLEREDFDLASGRHVYSLRVRVVNNGPVSLREFKLEVALPSELLADAPRGLGQRDERIDGHSYRVVSIFSPTAVPGAFRLFPGDELVLCAQNTQRQVLYMMDDEKYLSGLRQKKIFYTMWADNMPPLRGTVLVDDMICF